VVPVIWTQRHPSKWTARAAEGPVQTAEVWWERARLWLYSARVDGPHTVTAEAGGYDTREEAQAAAERAVAALVMVARGLGEWP